MIRGGQGRSGRQIEESAQAVAWCIGLAVLLLATLAWLQGGGP